VKLFYMNVSTILFIQYHSKNININTDQDINFFLSSRLFQLNPFACLRTRKKSALFLRLWGWHLYVSACIYMITCAHTVQMFIDVFSWIYTGLCIKENIFFPFSAYFNVFNVYLSVITYML